MEELKDQESCLVIKWLRKKISTSEYNAYQQKTQQQHQYVTLLSSTTFIDNTKNHSMVGGAFESDFCPGGGGFE